MKKLLITNLIISMILGIIITYFSTNLKITSCNAQTIVATNPTRYEKSFCKNSRGAYGIYTIKGYPFPAIKEIPRCKGICPMDMYSQQDRIEILWTNLFLDIAIWSALSFGIIASIGYLRKKKNAK